MWSSSLVGIVVTLALTAPVGQAFVLPAAKDSSISHSELRVRSEHHHDDAIVTSRREFLNTAAVLSAAATVGVASPVPAALAAAPSAKQEEIDKANVVKGYQRLQYLLDNWDKETTVCGMGGDKLEVSCDRTPIKVMEYLGFKSTTDPLYKGEKTLRRLYDNAPASRDADFIDAVEVFSENAEEASSMAFVSSWGEANPGGGKDRVELFIERAKNNVIASRNSLKTVIDILELDATATVTKK